MNIEDIVQARIQYNYPCGHVKSNSNESIAFESLDFIGFSSPNLFKGTAELDSYHKRLLNSESAIDVNLGIVSVQFWGRCFVKSRDNFNQARVRARWLLEGNSRSGKNILDNDLGFNAVKSIRKHIADDNLGEAFWAVRDIPHLGVSFGSKLLAFIAPEKMGVYDSHIARFLTKNSSELSNLCSKKINPDIALDSPRSFRVPDKNRFENYSQFLQAIADSLNKKNMQWTENDSSHFWRAVDVERALFHMAKSENN